LASRRCNGTRSDGSHLRRYDVVIADDVVDFPRREILAIALLATELVIYALRHGIVFDQWRNSNRVTKGRPKREQKEKP
jgi:hypothetical protein